MRVLPANQPRPGRQRAVGVAGLGAETGVTASLPSRCSEPGGDTNSERRRCGAGRDSWQPLKTVEVVVPKLGFTGEWQLTRDAGMVGPRMEKQNPGCWWEMRQGEARAQKSFFKNMVLHVQSARVSVQLRVSTSWSHWSDRQGLDNVAVR